MLFSCETLPSGLKLVLGRFFAACGALFGIRCGPSHYLFGLRDALAICSIPRVVSQDRAPEAEQGASSGFFSGPVSMVIYITTDTTKVIQTERLVGFDCGARCLKLRAPKQRMTIGSVPIEVRLDEAHLEVAGC